jgi:1-acyl-sn-glycerol-3-phosphate acyltransferase
VLDGIRRAAGRAPGPLGPVLDLSVSTVGDWVNLLRGVPQARDVDEWDPEYIRKTLPALGTLFDVYFRPEVSGLENIPAEGASLLVGNHSGGTMIADTFVLAVEFYRRFGPERRFHQLAHDVAVALPTLGTMIRRYGTLAASHDNARRAFRAGSPILVYPGGDYESFRPSWHSDRIEFGGRKGFIDLALDERVPLVPVVAIGGQETGLFLTRGQTLARLLMLDRLLRIKVLPVVLGPPFGVSVLDLPMPRIPLPAKIEVRVLPPIDLRERFGDDADRDAVYEQVTGEMQRALDELARERDLPLLG